MAVFHHSAFYTILFPYFTKSLYFSVLITNFKATVRL